MVIAFYSRKMEKLFNSRSELVRKYGARMAQQIENVMTFLEAVPNLQQVPQTPPFRRHSLSGKKKGQFAVDLIHPFRLQFVPDHNPIPRNDDGSMDLVRITAIKLISVEDYH